MQTVADGELTRFTLSYNRFVVVNRFNGQIYVHIRQYKENLQNGKTYPTRIGVTLNPSRFAVLCMHSDEITQALDNIRKPEPSCVQYTKHLGGGIYVGVTTGVECVDLRRYFVPKESKDKLPTRNGIALKFGEWRKFIALETEIKKLSPTLLNAQPCSYDVSHSNQEAAMSCKECNPFGYDDDDLPSLFE